MDEWTQKIIFNGLRENWFETADSLAKRLNLSRTSVLGALGAYTQAGRVIYDLNKQVYRVQRIKSGTSTNGEVKVCKCKGRKCY